MHPPSLPAPLPGAGVCQSISNRPLTAYSVNMLTGARSKRHLTRSMHAALRTTHYDCATPLPVRCQLLWHSLTALRSCPQLVLSAVPNRLHK